VGGFEGGLPDAPFGGSRGRYPRCAGVRGKCPQEFFCLGKHVTFFCLAFHVASIFVSIVGRFFGTWFFADGFLFMVKKLRLLTNPSYWVRVLDATGSYIYIVL
jgi:hypothetical protein